MTEIRITDRQTIDAVEQVRREMGDNPPPATKVAMKLIIERIAQREFMRTEPAAPVRGKRSRAREN